MSEITGTLARNQHLTLKVTRNHHSFTTLPTGIAKKKRLVSLKKISDKVNILFKPSL